MMYLSLAASCLFLLPSLSRAQSSVPSDLSSQFDPSSLTLQVIYGEGGENDHGFADGAKFTSDQTSAAPTFALGDASGVNTQLSFVIMMVDTTSDSDRVLHFMQTGVKATGDETALAAQSKPVVPYKAPGTLGDTGLRKYSWLMYSSPSTFTPTSMPASGSSFDVQDFLSKNDLQPAIAGVGMQVQMSGGNAGSQSTQQAPAPAQSTSQAPPPATTQAPPSDTTLVATVAFTSPAAAPSAAATTIIVPSGSSVEPAASQVLSSATAAIGSAVFPSATPSMSDMMSGTMSGMMSSMMSVATSAAVAPSSAGGASAGGAGATATTSSVPTQTSNSAIAHRGNAFAALPLFILAGALLG